MRRGSWTSRDSGLGLFPVPARGGRRRGLSAALVSRHVRLRRRPGSAQRRRARAVVLVLDVAAVLGVLMLFWPERPLARVYALAVLASLAVSGAYQLRIRLHVLDEVPFLLSRLTVPALLMLPIVAARTGAVWRLPVLVASTGLALCLARGVAYAVVRRGRRKGSMAEPTVIVGTGGIARKLEAVLTRHPQYGLRPVGFIDEPSPPGDLPRPVLGTVADLEDVLRRVDVQRVVVAFGVIREAHWVSILRTAVLQGVEVHVVPRFFDVGMATGAVGKDEIWGIPLLRVRSSALRTTTWRIKRIFDVALSALGLVLIAPLLGVVALAVRLTSPGPILYRQIRVGQNGRWFELLKFRSMRQEHDGGSSWRAPSEDLTPIGGFLRRTSLDELPQLWNVLKGDMSLVGPRPERPAFAEVFSAAIPGYVDRHRLAVGLTGLAQIHGLRGEDTSMEDRARFDNLYIEGWTLWLDVVVLLRTVLSVVRDAVSQPSQERAG